MRPHGLVKRPGAKPIKPRPGIKCHLAKERAPVVLVHIDPNEVESARERLGGVNHSR